MTGYVMFPCFTVEAKDGGFQLTCNEFLSWVFEHIFSLFWDGEIVITER